jgi:hypothetical protein
MRQIIVENLVQIFRISERAAGFWGPGAQAASFASTLQFE